MEGWRWEAVDGIKQQGYKSCEAHQGGERGVGAARHFGQLDSSTNVHFLPTRLMHGGKEALAPVALQDRATKCLEMRLQ